MRTLLALAAVVLAGVTAQSAFADRPVIPDDPSLPWTDPAHNSQLERLLTRLAADIAERPNVRVYCNGQMDWNTLGAGREFNPNGVSGFVDMRRTRSGTIARDSTDEHLSPLACWHLWMLAKAPRSKPTMCSLKGYARTRVACYPRAAHIAPPAGGWATYDRYASALLVFAHESIHLFDFRAGYAYLGRAEHEARATCFGLQFVSQVAQELGANVHDSTALERYAWEQIYPRHRGTAYWTPRCRENDPDYDLSPGDGVWP